MALAGCARMSFTGWRRIFQPDHVTRNQAQSHGGGIHSKRRFPWSSRRRAGREKAVAVARWIGEGINEPYANFGLDRGDPYSSFAGGLQSHRSWARNDLSAPGRQTLSAEREDHRFRGGMGGQRSASMARRASCGLSRAYATWSRGGRPPVRLIPWSYKVLLR
jgi:hypothetical protein